ncbi:MAG: hypothetical protein ABSC18_02820 [Verrucomicrobiota bacterium]|jgi:hypothetical protein
MFNLEQSITEWRRRMLAAGIKTPVPLEELEIHLREDVEQGMRSGLTAEAAFETAAQRVGQADALKSEFKKAGKTNCCGRIDHNRVYVTALFVLFVFLIALPFLALIPTPGLNSQLLVDYFQSAAGKNTGGGLMGMYSMFMGGGFEKCPVVRLGLLTVFLRSWGTALTLCFSLASGLALCARILHPNTGRWLTRLLNLALLPVFPIGTVIGIYGLTCVDRQKTQHV